MLGGFLAARARDRAREPERPARADGHPDADHPGARAGLRGRDTGAAGWRARPGPGPSRHLDGIPVGFERSERGAVAAAGSYLTVLAQTVSPRAPWTWTHAIRALTVAPFRTRALAAGGASETIKDKLAQASTAFVGSWLLGYRVIVYARARAEVAVWNVGLLASPSSVVAPVLLDRDLHARMGARRLEGRGLGHERRVRPRRPRRRPARRRPRS